MLTESQYTIDAAFPVLNSLCAIIEIFLLDFVLVSTPVYTRADMANDEEQTAMTVSARQNGYFIKVLFLSYLTR